MSEAITDPPRSADVPVPVPVTGHPVVDQVLASLDGLEHRPTHEHVAVLEVAHDRLREALEDAGTDGDTDGDSPPAEA